MRISVNCASGIESMTKRELISLGYGEIPAKNGRFYLEGEKSDIAALNIKLRTAERVMLVISEFSADTFDMLYDGTRACRWEQYVSARGKILVKGKCVKSKLFAVSACQKIVKKAIADSLSEKYKLLSLPEDGEAYTVEFSIFEDVVTLSIDTSGEALHKRGYRDLSASAPIKETLAAALVMLSQKKEGQELYDVFCGSGTIPIEAAMIERHIAPNLNRSFAYEAWESFHGQETQGEREKAKQEVLKPSGKLFYACDIDQAAVSMAVRHSKRAGVFDSIRFAVADMRSFQASEGVIISNLPYGERLMNTRDVIQLYRDFGKVYEKCVGVDLCALTGSNAFESYFGKKADKKRRLYNGALECTMYLYKARGAGKNGKNKNRQDKPITRS